MSDEATQSAEFEETLRERAASVVATSDTIEDWLAATAPPVRDGGIQAAFCVLEGSGGTELLTVTPANALLNIRPSNSLDVGAATSSADAVEATEKSDAGWIHIEHPVEETRPSDRPWKRGELCELQAFEADGQAHALAFFREDGGTRQYIEPLRRDPTTGEWAPWELRGQAVVGLFGAAQGGVYAGPDGECYIYGRSEAYSGEEDTVVVITRDAATGEWRAPLLSFEKGAYTYRMVPNTVAGSFGTLLRLGDGATVGSRTLWMRQRGRATYIDYAPEEPGRWTEHDLGDLVPRLGALSACRVTPLPGRVGEFIVRGADGRLHLVTDFFGTPRVQGLSEDGTPPAATVQVALDHALPGGSGPAVTLFMVADNGARTLFVKREDRSDLGAHTAFGPWVPLTNACRAIAAPVQMRGGAEIFVVNDDRTERAKVAIEHHSMGAGAEGWSSPAIEVLKPEADTKADRCSVHVTNLELRTREGGNAYRAGIGLRASYPCTAVVNGVSRHLRPDRPVQVYADPQGRVQVRIKADSIETPTYSVEFDGGATATVRTDEAVARRLGGLEEHAPLTTESLKDAGLMPDKLRETTQRRLTQMVRETGRTIGRNMQAADGLAMPAFTTTDARWFRGTVEQGTWHITAGHGSAPETLDTAGLEVVRFDDPGSHGLGFIGDLFAWIARGAQQVAAWTAQVVRDGLAFVIQVGQTLYDFTVRTAQGIKRGMEALFQGMAKMIGQAIDAAKGLLKFVTALFAIDDIRRTNRCFEYLIDGGLRTIKLFLTQEVPRFTNALIDTGVAKVDAFLEPLEQHFKGMTLGQLLTGGFPNKPDGGSTHAGQTALLKQVQAQTGWVGDRLMTHPEALDRLGAAVATDATSGLLDNLKAIAETVYSSDPDKRTFFTIVRDRTLELFEAIKTGGLLGMRIDQLFGLLRDVLKQGAEFIKAGVKLVFGFVGSAFDFLADVLAFEPKIPGIDQLAQLVLGRSLKVGDLLTLFLAVATTVFWKIIRKGAPPVTAEQERTLYASDLFPPATQGLAATQNDDWFTKLFNFVVAFCARGVGLKLTPSMEKAIRTFLEDWKAWAFALSWLGDLLVVAKSLLTILAGIVLGATRRVADTLKWGAWKESGLGILETALTLFGVALALARVLISQVEQLTIVYFPESNEAKEWRKRHTLVEPLSGMTFAWVGSVVFGLWGLICKPSGGKVAAWAQLVLGALTSAVCLVANVWALVRLLEKNPNRVRPSRIAREIGYMLAVVPAALDCAIPVCHYLMKVTKGFTAVIGGLITVVNAACTFAAAVCEIVSIVDEGIAGRWHRFEPGDLEGAAAAG